MDVDSGLALVDAVENSDGNPAGRRQAGALARLLGLSFRRTRHKQSITNLVRMHSRVGWVVAGYDQLVRPHTHGRLTWAGRGAGANVGCIVVSLRPASAE